MQIEEKGVERNFRSSRMNRALGTGGLGSTPDVRDFSANVLFDLCRFIRLLFAVCACGRPLSLSWPDPD